MFISAVKLDILTWALVGFDSLFQSQLAISTSA